MGLNITILIHVNENKFYCTSFPGKVVNYRRQIKADLWRKIRINIEKGTGNWDRYFEAHSYFSFSQFLVISLKQILWSEIPGTQGLHCFWEILKKCPLDFLFQFRSLLALFWKCLTTSCLPQYFFICIPACSFILWSTRSHSLTVFTWMVPLISMNETWTNIQKYHLNINILQIIEKILFINHVPSKN